MNPSREPHIVQVRGYFRIDVYERPVQLTLGALGLEAQRELLLAVHSNDDSLTPADLALGYKQLQRVEESWRSLKSGLRVRPVYHWAVHRIHAHVALSVLALLLERVIEQACGDTWRNLRDCVFRAKVATDSGRTLPPIPAEGCH